MTDPSNLDPADGASLRGWIADLSTDDHKRRAIELALDYRGDVTLTLNGGQRLLGFVFNRDASESEAWLEMFPKGEPDARRIEYREVAGLEFTGADAAAGRSWEAWLKKVAEAQEKGVIAELYPEEIDD